MHFLSTSRSRTRPMINRCSILLVLLAPVAALGQVTEEEAVQRAMSRPEVRDVIEGEIDVARGDALRAGMWSNPVASYSREQVYGGPAASAENYVELSQAIDISGRRSLRGQAGDGGWKRHGNGASRPASASRPT